MKRFPYGKAFLFSFGFLGVNIIWTLFNSFVPLSLNKFGLSTTLIGFVMTWGNYLNLFIQPITGGLSDRIQTPIGYRKPWILIGAPLAALAFAGIGLSTSLISILVAIILTDLCMSVFRAPIVSLLGDLFPAEQRSIAGGIHDLMGGLGAIIALLGSWFLFENLHLGFAATFIFGSVVMILAISVMLLRVREPQRLEVNKQKLIEINVIANLSQVVRSSDRSIPPLIIALLFGFLGSETVLKWLSSFGVLSLGINPGRMSGIAASFALSFLVMAVPAGLLAERFGRKKIILTGFMIVMVLFALSWWVQNEFTLLGVLILGGAAWSLVSVNALPALYDRIDKSSIGAITGLYYLASNIAAIIGPPVAGFFINWTQKNYHVIFIMATFCMLVAVLLMLRVNEKIGINKQESSL